MPDARTHRKVGAVAAFAGGVYTARREPLNAAVARVVGSTLGGQFGAALPDAFEPGLHSWHREFFHSYAVLVGTGAATLNPPASVRLWFGDREAQAAALRARREALPEGHPDRVGLWLGEMLLQLLLGAAIGIAIGYASHLILDGGSPRGLPLI